MVACLFMDVSLDFLICLMILHVLAANPLASERNLNWKHALAGLRSIYGWKTIHILSEGRGVLTQLNLGYTWKVEIATAYGG